MALTISDILTQYKTLKVKVSDFYTLIYNEVNSDVNLDDLNSTSKSSDYNLWMWMNAALAVIMDSVWNDRQQQIIDKVNNGITGTDRWYQLELFKFQYGDTLQWNAENGKYYYDVIDPTKQIIKRCGVISSGGITQIKVAKLNGTKPVALTSGELISFTAFVRQTQWSGAKIANPISFNSDKLNAPMTVYYDGTKKQEDIKAIVEASWVAYLDNLPFNSEYSVNKHGDYVENSSADIKEVNMGTVQARADLGSFTNVIRVYTPVSGYMEQDNTISFVTMITYVPV